MEENSPKYDYPDCVDKDNIYSNDNGVNRIVLKIPLKGGVEQLFKFIAK
jgi:hypothetical protein